ncbi:hypothetical protein AAG906_006898 [Vitis piasezkii]
MEATLEDQHSQHALEENINSYRSMRDRIAIYKAASDPTTYCATSIYFPWDGKTNGLKRQISNFSLKRMRNSMSVGRDTWKLSILLLTMALIPAISELFYNGMSSSMKQLLETMCGGEFMSKNSDTWLLVSYFYNGMSSSMKQLLETMCGGDFMSKNLEEAMDFLSYVAEVSRGWDELNAREVGRMKS